MGVQLDTAASEVMRKAMDLGLLVILAGEGDVVRIAPPLIVSDDEIGEAVGMLGMAVEEVLA